ncbi:MAG: hypothetical protein ACM3WQ_04090 [Chloroflexota bacterium]
MKNRLILIAVFLLTLTVLVLCVISELSWNLKEQTQEPIRKITGLPSIAIGNLNPAARNPKLEIICTGLYDQPGGYCYYFSTGVPFEDYQYLANITLSGSDK